MLVNGDISHIRRILQTFRYSLGKRRLFLTGQSSLSQPSEIIIDRIEGTFRRFCVYISAVLPYHRRIYNSYVGSCPSHSIKAPTNTRYIVKYTVLFKHIFKACHIVGAIYNNIRIFNIFMPERVYHLDIYAVFLKKIFLSLQIN